MQLGSKIEAKFCTSDPRLTSLEQCSLEKRRIVHDLILMYKFVFSLVDVQTSNLITPRNDAVPTRGNPYKVLLTVSPANVRRHFFTERTALIWTSLPPSVVHFRSLSSFKKTIYNASLYLHGIDVLCFRN